MQSIPIKDILVPDYMTEPSPEKYEKYLKKYQKKGLNGGHRIVINQDNEIVDGYITYLILKAEDPDREVEIIRRTDYRNKPTTYVFGKHPHSADTKTYVWRMPAKVDYIPQVGEIVLAHTKFGTAPVVVEKSEILEQPPYNAYIKAVCKWNFEYIEKKVEV